MSTATAVAAPNGPQSPTIAGHPPGLFLLFFVEMWERFSFYGMRALLIFYMMKGFLKMDDASAYGIYAAYGALVYATPFFGGMLADKVMGTRAAIILGGALMAAGHFVMMFEHATAFYFALALLIAGNGFFKPNISTTVGRLYGEHPGKKDAGFTLFYIGINLGAALAPLVCGYIGETYGWHWGFGLATIGMLVGLSIFVAPTRVSQALIMLCALATTGTVLWTAKGPLLLAINGFVGLALLVSAGVAVAALNKGGVPQVAGAPPANRPTKKIVGLSPNAAIYVGTLAAVVACALLVQDREVAHYLLYVLGVLALGYILFHAFRGTKVERHRLFVVLILMFFSLLFWAFFEQAGSSINNFTDRNVDRVAETRTLTVADVGTTVPLTLSQEQLGHTQNGKVFTMDQLDAAKTADKTDIQWKVDESHVGMGIGGETTPASIFQSANPIYILLFGLAFTAVWGFLGSRGREPSTTVKFGLGMIQLGLGFGALWYGASHADARGMVGVTWLLVGYLFMTTGELCLSPVGLAMVTRLSPQRIVSTLMGAWFLATTFSHLLAGGIAKLTGVTSAAGDKNVIPAPIDTVNVYGEVFYQIGIAAAVSGVALFALAPLLTKWMHEDEPDDSSASDMLPASSAAE